MLRNWKIDSHHRRPLRIRPIGMGHLQVVHHLDPPLYPNLFIPYFLLRLRFLQSRRLLNLDLCCPCRCRIPLFGGL